MLGVLYEPHERHVILHKLMEVAKFSWKRPLARTRTQVAYAPELPLWSLPELKKPTEWVDVEVWH